MTAVLPLQWLGDGESSGVRERRFEIDRAGRRVPGVLWTPAETPCPAGGRPLVLLGHGASGHKRQDYVVSMARRLARHHGLASASIDGPVHGDRRPPGAPSGSRFVFLEFAQAWSSDASLTDEMAADYSAVLDALQALDEVRPGPAGWWGLSMGTILGLPFVAGEPRITAAVLGLMGLTGPTRHRIEADAPAITCPVLFLVQWDDELFSRETALSLFEAIGSGDKQLFGMPGGHGGVTEEGFELGERWLARRLA